MILFFYSFIIFFVVFFALLFVSFWLFFFFSSRRRHTRCALVTGVQTWALPISLLACSRNVMRERPNWRIYPRGRPVRVSRFLSRVGLELRGNLTRPS